MMASLAIGWALLAAPEPLYLDEAPPPVRRWSLTSLSVEAPVEIEAGALLVVDIQAPPLHEGGCRHVSAVWQGTRWPSRRVQELQRVLKQ